VDWEPLESADEPIVIDLAKRIRAAVPSAVLTIPIGYININLGMDLTNYPAIAAAYDQLNIMSYGMAGAWQGWKSWHSSPLYQQDSATPTSIDSSAKLYIAAGVPKQNWVSASDFMDSATRPRSPRPFRRSMAPRSLRATALFLTRISWRITMRRMLATGMQRRSARTCRSAQRMRRMAAHISPTMTNSRLPRRPATSSPMAWGRNSMGNQRGLYTERTTG